MKTRKILTLIAATAAAGVCWYLFRPELLFVNRTVKEGLPTLPAAAAGERPEILAAGHFRGIAHETKGDATLYRLADGRRLLRLTDLQSANGPDVRVLLVGAPDARDSESIRKAGFVDLGALKGNQGDQNYDLPAGLDLAQYRSVTIWCARFKVNFGTAALASGQSARR